MYVVEKEDYNYSHLVCLTCTLGDQSLWFMSGSSCGLTFTTLGLILYNYRECTMLRTCTCTHLLMCDTHMYMCVLYASMHTCTYIHHCVSVCTVLHLTAVSYLSAEVSIEEASRQTASASPEASTPLQAELEVLKTKCSSLEAQLAVSRSELDMRERAAEESRKLLEGELSSQRVSLEEANAVLSCQVASLTEKNQDLESGLREHVAQVSRESEWRGCLVAELEGEKQANRGWP